MSRKRMYGAWLVLAMTTACSKPGAGQTADLSMAADPAPRQLLEMLRGGERGALATLLSPAVTFTTVAGSVQGSVQVSAAVQPLSVPANALVESHHDVARVTLADGSLLFAAADGAGHVTTLLQFPAGDGTAPSAALRAYQDAWNADRAARRALLATAWSPSGRYVDPTIDTRGVDALDQAIADFHQRFAGATIAAKATVALLPGDWLLAEWTIHAPGGDLGGFDVGHSDGSGQIAFIAGFFSPR